MEVTRTPEQRAADQRRFFRDFAVLVGLPFLAMAGLLMWWRPWTPDYTPPADTDIYAIVAGTWGWSTAPDSTFCRTSQHTISFSSDRGTMTITQAQPWTDDAGIERQVSVYDIRQLSKSRLRGEIRGETRMTDEGQPVVWDLVLTSPDSYTWHRTDWSALSYTGTIMRCPADTPPARVMSTEVPNPT